MSARESSPRFFIASGCPIATTTLYRCVHLQEQLKRLGYEAEVAEWFDDGAVDANLALRYDVLFLYRLQMSPALGDLIARAREMGKPVIFDTDDLIFEPDLIEWHRGIRHLTVEERELHLEGVRRYRETLLACGAATVATPVLAQLVRALGRPVYVHRNALGNEMLALAEALLRKRTIRQPNERLVIGYGSGTPTHDVDFEEVTIALVNILDRFPKIELWIGGPLTVPPQLARFGQRLRSFPLTHWRDWFELLNQMDIALAPLEQGNIFCRAKSEIKFVEAGALGLPVVASDIDPFQDSITNGENGLLAANPAAWIRALTLLIEEPDQRRRIGEAAHRAVLNRYSLQARSAELMAILPRLMQSSFSVTGSSSPSRDAGGTTRAQSLKP